MIKSIKIMLKPNNEQKSLLFQCAGAARFAFNWALAKEEENHKAGNKFINDGDLRKELTKLKKPKSSHGLKSTATIFQSKQLKMLVTPIKTFLKVFPKNPSSNQKEKLV